MILFLHPREDYELHGCRRFKRSDKRAETRIARLPNGSSLHKVETLTDGAIMRWTLIRNDPPDEIGTDNRTRSRCRRNHSFLSSFLVEITKGKKLAIDEGVSWIRSAIIPPSRISRVNRWKNIYAISARYTSRSTQLLGARTLIAHVTRRSYWSRSGATGGRPRDNARGHATAHLRARFVGQDKEKSS